MVAPAGRRVSSSSHTGAAVVVAPGGAFLSLSMTGEGSDIAHWLADRGVAAFVLKYRLNPTPRDDRGFLGAMGARMGEAAARFGVRDADVTMAGLVRSAAEEGARR